MQHETIVLPVPVAYRAWSTPRKSRTARWSDVRIAVELPVRVVRDSDVSASFDVGAFEATRVYVPEDEPSSAVVVDGRIHWPSRRIFNRGPLASVAPLTVEALRRQVAQIARGDAVDAVNLPPYGVDLSQSANKLKYVHDEDLLGPVEWSDRADRIADAVRAAAAMVVRDGRVLTSRFEPAVVYGSSGSPTLSMCDVLSKARLLEGFDLEQDVVRFDKMAGREGCPDPGIELPVGVEWRLPDVDVSALLSLRRCIRSMFVRSDLDAVVGSGQSYAAIPDEFEDALHRLRRVHRSLEAAIGSGGTEAAEARDAVADYVDLVRRTQAPVCNWSGGAKEKRLREMSMCLESWDSIHSNHVDVPAPGSVHAEDEDALSLAAGMGR